MNSRPTNLQKQLYNVLQRGLPVCQRPFAELAKSLCTDEQTVLRQVTCLKETGLIRRIGPIIDYRALGRKGTLVMAHVPQSLLKDVTEAVNSLETVSHNYLRDHYYNLWFTRQSQTMRQTDLALSGLSSRFGIDFHSLPARRIFKLDVYFGTENRPTPVAAGCSKRRVRLTAGQKRILYGLQNQLNVTAEPFDFLRSGNCTIEETLSIVRQLIDAGVIRRIAAVLDHRKLGFVANCLFVCRAADRSVAHCGRALADVPMVSHCCQRKTLENWPYNLYAMMHSQSMDEIQMRIKNFVASEKLKCFELLPTAAELKKLPVKYRF